MPYPVFIFAKCWNNHEWEVAVAENGLDFDLTDTTGIGIECPECISEKQVLRMATTLMVRPIA